MVGGGGEGCLKQSGKIIFKILTEHGVTSEGFNWGTWRGGGKGGRGLRGMTLGEGGGGGAD